MTTPTIDTARTPAREDLRTVIAAMRTAQMPHRDPATVAEPLDPSLENTAPSFGAQAVEPEPVPVVDVTTTRALVVDRVATCDLDHTERHTLKAAMRRAGVPSFDRLD